MTEIVHQASHRHISDVIWFDVVVRGILGISSAELPANIVEEMHLLLRQVADSQAVGESSMRRSWKNVIESAQLVHVLQSRIDWVVDVLPQVELELYPLGIYGVLAHSAVHSVIVGGVFRWTLVFERSEVAGL